MAYRPPPSPLAPFAAFRRADGAQGWDRFDREERYAPQQGAGLERWMDQRRPPETSQRTSYSGLGPQGWRRSDERILEEVCEELRRNSEIDASEVEVRCQEGEITLTGTVRDRHQKRLAEWVADGTNGVRDVHNRLRVLTSQQTNVLQGRSEPELATESTVTGTTRGDTTNRFGVS